MEFLVPNRLLLATLFLLRSSHFDQREVYYLFAYIRTTKDRAVLRSKDKIAVSIHILVSDERFELPLFLFPKEVPYQTRRIGDYSFKIT